MDDDEDVKIALELVASVEKYYLAVQKEPFDVNQYRHAEISLHEMAVVYGRRLHALKGGD